MPPRISLNFLTRLPHRLSSKLFTLPSDPSIGTFNIISLNGFHPVDHLLLEEALHRVLPIAYKKGIKEGSIDLETTNRQAFLLVSVPDAWTSRWEAHGLQANGKKSFHLPMGEVETSSAKNKLESQVHLKDSLEGRATTSRLHPSSGASGKSQQSFLESRELRGGKSPEVAGTPEQVFKENKSLQSLTDCVSPQSPTLRSSEYSSTSAWSLTRRSERAFPSAASNTPSDAHELPPSDYNFTRNEELFNPNGEVGTKFPSELKVRSTDNGLLAANRTTVILGISGTPQAWTHSENIKEEKKGVCCILRRHTGGGAVVIDSNVVLSSLILPEGFDGVEKFTPKKLLNWSFNDFYKRTIPDREPLFNEKFVLVENDYAVGLSKEEEDVECEAGSRNLMGITNLELHRRKNSMEAEKLASSNEKRTNFPVERFTSKNSGAHHNDFDKNSFRLHHDTTVLQENLGPNPEKILHYTPTLQEEVSSQPLGTTDERFSTCASSEVKSSPKFLPCFSSEQKHDVNNVCFSAVGSAGITINNAEGRSLSTSLGLQSSSFQEKEQFQAPLAVMNEECSDTTQLVKKVGGNAQAFSKNFVVQHTSFLWNMNIDMMNRFLKHPKKQPSYRSERSHGDFLVSIKEALYLYHTSEGQSVSTPAIPSAAPAPTHCGNHQPHRTTLKASLEGPGVSTHTHTWALAEFIQHLRNRKINTTVNQFDLAEMLRLHARDVIHDMNEKKESSGCSSTENSSKDESLGFPKRWEVIEYVINAPENYRPSIFEEKINDTEDYCDLMAPSDGSESLSFHHPHSLSSRYGTTLLDVEECSRLVDILRNGEAKKLRSTFCLDPDGRVLDDSELLSELSIFARCF